MDAVLFVVVVVLFFRNVLVVEREREREREESISCRIPQPGRNSGNRIGCGPVCVHQPMKKSIFCVCVCVSVRVSVGPCVCLPKVVTLFFFFFFSFHYFSYSHFILLLRNFRISAPQNTTEKKRNK